MHWLIVTHESFEIIVTSWQAHAALWHCVPSLTSIGNAQGAHHWAAMLRMLLMASGRLAMQLADGLQDPQSVTKRRQEK